MIFIYEFERTSIYQTYVSCGIHSVTESYTDTSRRCCKCKHHTFSFASHVHKCNQHHSSDKLTLLLCNDKETAS